MTNNILATWEDNYQDQLKTIKYINKMFCQKDVYLYEFEKLIQQTPEEVIENNDFEQILELGDKFINSLKQTRTYTTYETTLPTI